MHDATAHSFGAGGLRDRTTLAVSQKALGEYADRASKAIEDGLNESITSLDGHIADLDAALGNVEEGDNLVLEMDKQALVNAKATLVDLHAEFPKSPEAKRLNSVAAHAQMDTLVDKLNVDRNSVGGWKGVGPIVAAAVPQFIASMTHLASSVRPPVMR